MNGMSELVFLTEIITLIEDEFLYEINQFIVNLGCVKKKSFSTVLVFFSQSLTFHSQH